MAVPSNNSRLIVKSNEPEFLKKAFEVPKRSYKQQYANLYFVRLNTLKKDLVRKAKNRWSDKKAKLAHKLLDISGGHLSFGVGTVYMEMPLKPNVIDDITREHWIEVPPPRPKYCSENDQILLEDESGRVNLVGDILSEYKVVTGAVIAVLGKEDSEGNFHVHDICLPGIPPQVSVVTPPKESQYVAIVSGLNFGPKSTSSELCEFLLGYLSGNVPLGDSVPNAQKIVKLIVAGNSYDEPPPPTTYTNDPKKNPRTDVMKDLQNLDQFFTKILESQLPIDIMPGPLDPAVYSMPQPPFMKALLPEASKSPLLRTLTNPAWIEVNGSLLLGTSGQTINDMRKYMEIESSIGLIKNTLRWRHIAPTAPDTLGKLINNSYPFINHDPFIIEGSPRVYFVSNQPNFETDTVQGEDDENIRVISVPSFSETGQLVLVDLKTLECTSICFKG
ncbi:DNA polymerase delta small subunit Cdc1 [Mycoemilia scoparia]|uniref:DNA-directed DNA polymerase n=1 Tax=Mycoemilia scoparia TaxID=417184 RepID=A0A9W8A1X1_9FUNG|nr:DNA polymerase delta small subunit Cdc1 [Mycoemilia scoparia]